MKTLIIILTVAAFLQTTIIPLDLVLLILICRAYLKSDKANLYLAFGIGLLVAHLDLISLGSTSLIYLLIIQATQLLSKSRLAARSFLIVPISLILLSLNQILNSLLGWQTISFQKLALTSFLSWPLLYLVKSWEERFIVQKEVKLRV